MKGAETRRERGDVGYAVHVIPREGVERERVLRLDQLRAGHIGDPERGS